ncbi:hypothetical protein QFZ77_000007 [Paenibacillus sp. V4I3]|uniref:zinc-ribbon domain-containing protein n=1 Tax=Paenibacillus sp. V4I3 TaxID=3042305 RepID=UPI00277E39FA|nr:zinc-ribbon domain-containing protein [Paenibacillus sp. V4I3]MDQ0871348.1 hypothetical protein [Paenibacillus sp. V4I3]
MEFRSMASKNPDKAKLWHPTKNGYLTPDQVMYGSEKGLSNNAVLSVAVYITYRYYYAILLFTN